MEIFLPHDKFLHGKFPQQFPLLNLSSQPKNPPENVYPLPNNHYYMQTHVKIWNLQPLPRELWGSKSYARRFVTSFIL